MDVMDIAAPVLMCVVAIVAVAAVYFAVTALRDRRGKRRPGGYDAGDEGRWR